MAEVSTIARPYAKAAFEHALAVGQLSQWSQTLASAALVSADLEMKRVLASPALGSEEKATFFIDVCGADLGNDEQNFIRVLAEHKRLEVLPAVADAFEALKAKQEQAVDVDVISAFELSAEQQTMLTEKLKGKWQKDVSLKTQVDPSLIGGVIIRAGDLVIDDSVRGKLTRLAEAVNT
ncbi:MAG: F0F1 ATP synthase subunit delta [Pseudomonadales bacterium]|nr:F0F1 ATP synthase subunit delta [Pseudomonadales bacterium]